MHDFHRALASWGTAGFPAALQAELQALGLALPVQTACLAGGFPEPPTGLRVEEVREEGAHIHAAFEVSFTERAQPGCGGQHVDFHRQLRCLLTIDRATGQGKITACEPEVLDEF